MTTIMHRQPVTAATLADSDLTEAGFEMLRAAVNVARQFQSRDTATLRAQLIQRFPGREEDIQAALVFWANDIVRRYPAGPPRY